MSDIELIDLTKDHSEPFGALLRAYRGAAGMTQEELAARSGLSVQTVSMLERGVRRAPRSTTVEFLARALKLDSSQRTALVAAARRRTELRKAGRAAAWRWWRAGKCGHHRPHIECLPEVRGWHRCRC